MGAGQLAPSHHTMKQKLIATIGLLAFAVGVVFSVNSVVSAEIGAPPSNVREYSASPKLVTFGSSLRIVNDTTTDAFNLSNYGSVDVQYFVVGNDGSTPFTVTMQHSNDGTNWADAAADAFVGAVSTANSTDMTRTHNYGAFTRIKIDTTNSTPLTLTITGLAK